MVSPTLTSWLIGLLAVAAPGAGDEWPEFRGPSANGHSDATGVPREWRWLLAVLALAVYGLHRIQTREIVLDDGRP